MWDSYIILYFSFNCQQNYRSTVVDNFGLLELDVLRVAPQHGEHQVVDWRDRFVDWVEEGVQEIL